MLSWELGQSDCVSNLAEVSHTEEVDIWLGMVEAGTGSHSFQHVFLALAYEIPCYGLFCFLAKNCLQHVLSMYVLNAFWAPRT